MEDLHHRGENMSLIKIKYNDNSVKEKNITKFDVSASNKFLILKTNQKTELIPLSDLMGIEVNGKYKNIEDL